MGSLGEQPPAVDRQSAVSRTFCTPTNHPVNPRFIGILILQGGCVITRVSVVGSRLGSGQASGFGQRTHALGSCSDVYVLCFVRCCCCRVTAVVPATGISPAPMAAPLSQSTATSPASPCLSGRLLSSRYRHQGNQQDAPQDAPPYCSFAAPKLC